MKICAINIIQIALHTYKTGYDQKHSQKRVFSEDAEKLETSYTAVVMENSLAVPQMVKYRITI